MSDLLVVGAGHVGLVTAIGFASVGHRVRVLDIDAGRVRALATGRVWFYEPGLEEALAPALRRGRIAFTTAYDRPVARARVAFICVPVPRKGPAEDSELNGLLVQVVASIAEPKTVVIRTTAPVGTTDRLARKFRRSGARFVVNPEFLSEGRALADFTHPSRIVIGSRDRAAIAVLKRLYRTFRAPTVVTDPTTAELIKLVANTYLATKISYANVVAEVAAAVGADGRALRDALGLDPRIGPAHLRAGLGFGGSCLPPDLAALQRLARDVRVPASLLASVGRINRRQPARVVGQLQRALGSLAGAHIAVLGMSFKSGTDDIRGSPALVLAAALRSSGAYVSVHDPIVGRARIPRGLERALAPLDAARNADGVIVATDWPEYGRLDLRALRRAMRGDVLIDARGMLDPRAARKAGFRWYSLEAAL